MTTTSGWIGKTIGGRYQIESLLGKGGMSAVYKAYDPNLRRHVAAKLIYPHLSDSPAFVRRFEEEAAAVAQLRHPNIIQVHDFNHDGETYFIVFEFVPGETLQDRLKRYHAAGRILKPAEAVGIATEVGAALEYAHGQGLVHRDVKPANVMLNVRGEAILMDFGIVKIAGGTQHTATGAVLGTARYMSPEQITGKRIDHRTDVYSLGVMLFEMVGGQPPFESESAMSLMMMHMTDPVPDLSAIRPKTSPALVAVINKALSKNPDDRFQTAAEMVAALRAVDLDAPPIIKPDPDQTFVESSVTPVATISGKTDSKPHSAMPVAPITPEPIAPVAETSFTEEKPAEPMPPVVKEPATAASAKRTIPVWALGVIGVIALIIVAVAIYSAFGGGNRGEIAGDSGNEGDGAVAALATEAIEPVSTSTTAPTATHTPEPTATNTPEPSPTPTTMPTPTPVPVSGELRLFSLPSGNDVSMIYIPEGTFTMGSSDGDDDELPARDVYLDAYWIDEVEVTNAQFAAFVRDTSYESPTEYGCRYVYEIKDDGNGGWVCGDDADWQHPSGADSNIRNKNDYPVVQLSWDDAVAFCEWRGSRLPTEAEWEQAARGSDGRIYPWGDLFEGVTTNYCDVNCPFAWRHEINDDGHVEAGPVGNYPAGASAYGALDMAGNVWEWTADWYAADYYQTAPFSNPTGPESGETRVVRGGAWDVNIANLRASNRFDFVPSNTGGVGVRCVTAAPTGNPAPIVTPGPTATPAPAVRINNITLDNGRYVVNYETLGYTESLPNAMHIHFFFNTVMPENAGLPGGGPWFVYGGPRPFTGYGTGDRPASATQMCALVANADHSVIAGSGNCVNLPE